MKAYSSHLCLLCIFVIIDRKGDKMKKILIVDDEKPISDIIKFNMAKVMKSLQPSMVVRQSSYLKLSNQILLSWLDATWNWWFRSC